MEWYLVKRRDFTFHFG